MNLHFIRLRLGQNNTRMCYGKEECGMRLQTWKLEAQECSGNLRAKIDENIRERGHNRGISKFDSMRKQHKSIQLFK
jgi:hypothetical protein